MEAKPEKKSGKFKIGLAILLINTPLCYILMTIISIMGAKRRDPFLLMVSGIIFVLSWVFFGLGTCLAGPGGVREVKKIWGKIFKRKVKK